MKIFTDKQLKKKLDVIFSKYIRLKHSTNGVVKCITCGGLDDWKNCDAGHYISRQHLITRYDERNVFPQCKSCNRFHEGRKDEYALFLIKEFGKNILTELNATKWKPLYGFNFEKKIKEYKEKLKTLEEKI